jgi:hypothetical protein
MFRIALTLVIDDERFPINRELLNAKVTLFQGNPLLSAMSEYVVQSNVASEHVQSFVCSLQTDQFSVAPSN